MTLGPRVQGLQGSGQGFIGLARIPALSPATLKGRWLGRLGAYPTKWGFPNIRGTIFGVPVIRAIFLFRSVLGPPLPFGLSTKP